jgi:hypothetical protein
MLRHGPRTHYGEGSPQTVISGLHRTALALAVYASPPALPQRTQDSLLVAGQALPDGTGYPQGFNERFPSCFLHLVPLSQAFLAQSGCLLASEPCMCAFYSGRPARCSSPMLICKCGRSDRPNQRHKQNSRQIIPTDARKMTVKSK